MPRRHFIADLAVVEAISPHPSISSVQKGDDDGTLTFVYKPSGAAKAVEITAMIPELSEYPNSHQCYLYTTSDSCADAVTSALESITPHGLTLPQLLEQTANTLNKSLSSKRQKTSTTIEISDDEDGDEDMEYEEDEGEDDDDDDDDDDVSVGGWSVDSLNEREVDHEGDSQMGDTGPKEPDLVKRMCNDLRAAKTAGFKVGVLGDLPTGRGYLAISIRVSKLGISEEAMTAWKLDPARYLILLFNYSNGYKSLKSLVKDSYNAKRWLEMSVGVSDRYKPSLEEARAAFLKVKKGTDADGKVHIYGAPSGSLDVHNLPNSQHASNSTGYENVFISRPLGELLNERLFTLLNYRIRYGFPWDGAENFYDEFLGREREDTVDEKFYWQHPTPNSLSRYCTADAMLEKDASDAPFPLVSMQFMLRHFVRCTEFCLVCHTKIDNSFEALKPYVCSKPLCLYQYMALGFGPSMEYEILSQPSVVDLLVSLCWVSSSHGHLKDFPLGLNILVPNVRQNPYGGTYDRKRHELLVDEKLIPAPGPPGEDGRQELPFRLRNGDWISVQAGTYSENVQFRVVEADYWPRVRLGPAVGPATATSYFASDEVPQGNRPVVVDSSRIYFSTFTKPFDDLTEMEKRSQIIQYLDSFPTINEMREWLQLNTQVGEEALLTNWKNRMSGSACNLLRWIIASNRACIMQIDETPEDVHEFDVTKPATPGPIVPRQLPTSGEDRVSGMAGWAQFRFAMGAPDKEQRFQDEVRKVALQTKKSVPTLFAWHGSNIANWHSIIREGLHFNKVTNGRAYGDGVYFALQAATSTGYSGMYRGGGTASAKPYWGQSHLQISTALCLNEIVNAPEQFVSKSPYLVVKQLDWIQTRYLFVQSTSRAKPLTTGTTDVSPVSPLPQDPAMTPTGMDSKGIVIPASLASLRREKNMKAVKDGFVESTMKAGKKKASKISRMFGSGTSTDPISLENGHVDPFDGYASVETDAEDITILFMDEALEKENRDAANKSKEKIVPKKPAFNPFEPGTLVMDNIQLLAPPTYASPMATKRIQQELLSLLKVQDSHDLDELGWYINRELVDNVYQWIIELHSFDEKLPLAQDMKKQGIKSVVMEARFGKDFPMTPPFVRVIKPRFRPFMQGGGGHVTAGGALCMELLTNSGWSAVSSFESVLLQIRLALMSTEPNPARLDAGSNTYPYTAGEAKEAFVRACRTHGWTVPPDFNSL